MPEQSPVQLSHIVLAASVIAPRSSMGSASHPPLLRVVGQGVLGGTQEQP
jgi:hypothetical protein